MPHGIRIVSGELEWRWADPTGQQRAVRTDELRAALASGVIAPNTPVWRRGWAEWKPAHEVPELTTSALAAANGVVQNIPPPPLFMVAVQHQYEEKSGSPPAPAEGGDPPPPPTYVPMQRPPSAQIHTLPIPVPAATPSPKPPSVRNQPVAKPAADSSAKLKPAPANPPINVPGPGTSPAASHEHEPAKAHRPTAPGVAPPPTRPSFVPPADDSWDEPVPAKGGVPKPRPSETIAGSIQPSHDGSSEANTAVDLAALSPADADRVLEGKGGSKAGPTIIGVPAMQQPLPPPPPLRPASIPPPLPAKAHGHNIPTPPMPLGLGMGAPGTQPPPPVRSLKKDTLLLFGGAPSPARAQGGYQNPPIVVPGPAEKAPKAITQAPPWTEEGAMQRPDIPKSPSVGKIDIPPMRPRAESIEEISDAVMVQAPVESDASLAATHHRQRVEEISSSSLLPDASGSQNVVLPPPNPPPVVSTGITDDEAASREEQTGSVRVPYTGARIVHDLRELLGRPKQKWFIPLVLALSAVVFFGLVALVVSPFSGPSKDKDTAVASPATSSPSARPSVSVTPSAVVSAPPRPAPRGGACAMAGGPHVVAPKAFVPSGVEATVAGQKLVLGFATGPKDGLAVQLDPDTLSASATARAHSHDPIRRALPVLGSRLSAVLDADRKGEALQGARTIPGDPPFLVGASDGQLSWTTRSADTPNMIWPLQGDGPVEALRGVVLGDRGYAIAFRQGAAIFLGALHADKTPDGVLSKVPGLGPQVGSPALAATSDGVLVAWADRVAAEDSWGLRWLTWKPGDAPGDPRPFTIPPGGLGEQAMSPGVAALHDGRFLLVWTEGPVSSHQVRAETLSPLGAPVGAPITISAEGVNAGQGQAAVTEGGQGAVVFLASNGTGFEVVATPVTCP